MTFVVHFRIPQSQLGAHTRSGLLSILFRRSTVSAGHRSTARGKIGRNRRTIRPSLTSAFHPLYTRRAAPFPSALGHSRRRSPHSVARQRVTLKPCHSLSSLRDRHDPIRDYTPSHSWEIDVFIHHDLWR